MSDRPTATLRSRHERLLAALFVATLPLVNPYVRGDGNGYYAYVRSIVVDGDLRFENEYRHADPAFQDLVFRPTISDIRTLPRPGYAWNQFAAGASLFWAPFFLLAHVIVLTLNALGWPVAADGFSWPYLVTCAASTALYGFAGLLLAYRTAARFTSPASALAATIGIWFGSSLPVYMYFLPFHVHAMASFAVTLVVWAWVQGAATTKAGWLAWGILAGLAISVYQLNGLVLALPGAELLRRIVKRRERVTRIATDATMFGLGLLVALTPHFATRWVLYGSPLTTGYLDRFFWLSPRLWQAAFSAEHGMFVWTPILLGAVAGLIAWLRRDRWTAACLLGLFAAFFYVVSSYQNWHGQSAFGSRFMVSLTPVFVLGLAMAFEELAVLADRVHPPWVSRAVRSTPAAAVALLAIWNAGLAFQWGTNIVPNRGPVAFTTIAHNQISVVPERLAPFLRRYFTARQALASDIEREDLRERERYELRR